MMTNYKSNKYAGFVNDFYSYYIVMFYTQCHTLNIENTNI